MGCSPYSGPPALSRVNIDIGIVLEYSYWQVMTSLVVFFDIGGVRSTYTNLMCNRFGLSLEVI